MMFYVMPKKIQLAPSQAKWQLESSQSVLILVGLQNLRAHSSLADSMLMSNLVSITQKAKSLNIPIVDLYGDDLIQGMQQLGEYTATHPQLIFAGEITPTVKQILPYLHSVTEQICLVDDAVLLSSQEQHIHWLDHMSEQGFHHMNSYSLTRLWALSAPKEWILSTQGILLAVAEQLEIEVLEIDPHISLQSYGLDSVAIVTLVGLWRANGATIRYEDFEQGLTLSQLLEKLVQP